MHNGRARFWLNSDRAGHRAVVVTLSARCDASSARDDVRVDRFPGGCATYDFNFDAGDSSVLLAEVDAALDYTSRDSLIDHVDEEFGLKLCGRGVSCPG